MVHLAPAFSRQDDFFDPLQVDDSNKSSTRTTKSAKAKKRLDGKEVKEEKPKNTFKPLTARNERQAEYIQSLTENTLTFGIGPAGVGKTYIPSRLYGNWLALGRIEKIYVARPNVAKAKHKNGFLPGSMEDKTAPWLVPIFEGIRESMSPYQFKMFRENKLIEEVPFEFIQGRTFKNAACIVDEAENLDLDDLYITLTRQGDGLKMCLCGDILQARIPDSGFGIVAGMAMDFDMESNGVIVFNEDDVVRSKQAAQWVKAFKRRRDLINGNYDIPLPDVIRQMTH